MNILMKFEQIKQAYKNNFEILTQKMDIMSN